MSWLEHHRVSERLASEAQSASRDGHHDRAQELYSRAADAERQALADLDPAKARTFAISTVSAASLYYKAGILERAAELAHQYLDIDCLPEFAREQLTNLLRSIWGSPEWQQGTIEHVFPDAVDRAQDQDPVAFDASIEKLFVLHGESNQIRLLSEQLENAKLFSRVSILESCVYESTVEDLQSPWRLRETISLEPVADASTH